MGELCEGGGCHDMMSWHFTGCHTCHGDSIQFDDGFIIAHSTDEEYRILLSSSAGFTVFIVFVCICIFLFCMCVCVCGYAGTRVCVFLWHEGHCNVHHLYVVHMFMSCTRNSSARVYTWTVRVYTSSARVYTWTVRCVLCYRVLRFQTHVSREPIVVVTSTRAPPPFPSTNQNSEQGCSCSGVQVRESEEDSGYIQWTDACRIWSVHRPIRELTNQEAQLRPTLRWVEKWAMKRASYIDHVVIDEVQSPVANCRCIGVFLMFLCST